MAGINTLQEIYKKRGEAWTKEFLSSELRITEKTDAYRFSFEMSRNGKLRYYTKNAETPLNRIDRTVSDLYESAIFKIENLPEAILINLPKSHRFGFNYLPESGLILTDITIRQGGKLSKQIHEKEILTRWADLFHVKSEDEVHSGRLSESKVDSLLKNLRNGIYPMLESVHTHKTFIIRNDENVVKIAPPTQRNEIPAKSHTFDLLLMQIYEHIHNFDLDRFPFRSSRPDEKYIEVVCEAFNSFVKEKGLEFLEMGIKKPEFLEKSGKFNRRWIKNQSTLQILESHKDYEYLLSVFLVNLRKPKKASGLLTESFVQKYNQKIEEIDESVKSTDDYSFPEFSSILEREIEISTDSGFSGEEHMKAVGMLQTYFARPFMNTSEGTDEEATPCNVVIINMGKFTKVALAECERIFSLTDNPIILIHDESAGNACLWGLDSQAGVKAAQQVAKQRPDIFCQVESMHYPTLEKIKRIAKGKAVKKILIGRSLNSMQKEYESYVTVLGGYIGECEIEKIRTGSDREIEECMDKEDYTRFKEVFPDAIQPFWSNMRSQWSSRAYIG